MQNGTRAAPCNHARVQIKHKQRASVSNSKHLVTYANQVYTLFQQLAIGSQVQHGSLEWVRDALPHIYSLCTLQANTLPSSHSLVFQNLHLHTLSCLYCTKHLSKANMMRMHITVGQRIFIDQLFQVIVVKKRCTCNFSMFGSLVLELPHKPLCS